MVCTLIDFALAVLKLFMFKVCGIIGISKIELFNIAGTERLKKRLALNRIQTLFEILFSANST